MVTYIKKVCFIIILSGLVSIMLYGCGSQGNNGGSAQNSSTGSQTSQPGQSDTGTQIQSGTQSSPSGTQSSPSGTQTAQKSSSGSSGGSDAAGIKPADLSTVKPNEDGKIMVVMFHNFIDTYQKGDKAYTTTFDSFRALLQTLYDGGYRLVSLNDYLNDNINVAAGYIPMVFTFDDGTAGQFNLVQSDGKLTANSRSAVGIMEGFARLHPDFGLKGTFFVNLGNNTFPGGGTLQERLKYLTDEGFEIGNHTYSHINLKKAGTADEIQKEIGGNQKRMYELLPGYTFNAFSLPYGEPSKELQKYVVSGEYEGVRYDNRVIVEVGWDPSVSPASKKFDPLSTHRVRASGITPVDADLAWWLKNLTRAQQYVSDGNPGTVTVPSSKAADIDVSKLNGKKLVVY